MDNLVTVQEACEALGISRATLYRLKDAGQLRTVKVRGSRKVSVSALKAIIEHGTNGKKRRKG